MEDIQTDLFRRFIQGESQMIFVRYPKADSFLPQVQKMLRDAYIQAIVDLLAMYSSYLGTEKEWNLKIDSKMQKYQKTVDQIISKLPKEIFPQNVKWETMKWTDKQSVIFAATNYEDSDEFHAAFDRIAGDLVENQPKLLRLRIVNQNLHQNFFDVKNDFTATFA